MLGLPHRLEVFVHFCCWVCPNSLVQAAHPQRELLRSVTPPCSVLLLLVSSHGFPPFLFEAKQFVSAVLVLLICFTALSLQSGYITDVVRHTSAPDIASPQKGGASTQSSSHAVPSSSVRSPNRGASVWKTGA